MIFKNLQLDLKELPTIQSVDYRKLAPAYLKVSVISILIFYAFLFIGVILFLKFAKITKVYEVLWYILPTIWLVLMILGLYVVIRGFKIKGYALREKDIVFRKGLVFNSVTTIPFNRVQHCEIKQGPIERIFGLKTLALFTAGGQASDLRIPGLLPGDAEQLKAFIIKTTVQDEYEEE